MKTRLTAAIASLVFASLGATAFAQDAQQVPPQQQTPPQQQMPPMTSGQMGQSTNATSSMMVSKVRRALARQGITATNVSISVSGGTATLSGTVATRQDVSKAKRAAMQVRGITQVDVSGLHAR
jgi:osmotically-inducible protein OsmY